MLYCPPNVTFLRPWMENGFSHCFMNTIASSILFFFISIFGGIQLRMYYKYSSDLDSRLLPKSFLYKVQLTFHVLQPIVAIIQLILHYSVLYDCKVYGYMIFSTCLYSVAFLIALKLLLLERHKVLPSVPTRRHGLILLIFWTVAFIVENLTLLNIQSERWWFLLNSFSDKIEFGFFAFRFFAGLLLFILGLKAPGIPHIQDYLIFRSLHTQVEDASLLENEIYSASTNQTAAPPRNPSAFSNIGKKCKQLAPFLWPKKSLMLQLRVIFCLFILILGRVLNVYVPLFNKYIVDSLSLDYANIKFRWDYILIYGGLWFFQGQGNNSFLSNIRSFMWIRVQQYTVKEIQLEMYQHLHGLSLGWHLNRKIGEVLRVMDRGTSSISSLLSYIIFNILPTFADIFIAVIYFALVFNIWFGLIVLVTMLLYLASTVVLTEWRTRFRRKVNLLDNEVEARCVDSLLNFETVKYYSAEKYELENYRKAIDEYQVAEWMSTASLNLLNTIQNGIITLGVLCGSLLCAHLVVDRKLTAGDYVLFSSYILQLYTPLNFFGTYYRMIQTAFVDMENMFTLFDTKPEIIDAHDAIPIQIKHGSIEFKNVNFSYLPERQILKNISFVVQPGCTVALVGPTGSGKSTITRLLFRFYDIQSGEILIDKQNIAKVTQDSLRQCIGVVPQDTVLFNNDIRYNIRYGKTTASDEEVLDAARAADIHTQINSFPNGYDTVVGERGLKLSGGEKQRVAIARTILKDPSFIVLDEATSSLDTQTERNIQNALTKICINKTTIVVAHRLSTIIQADEILVLKEGEIVERGRHNDLLENKGIYAAMWQQQLQPEKEGDQLNHEIAEDNE